MGEGLYPREWNAGLPSSAEGAVPCRTLRFGWQPVHPPASGQSWSHSGGGGEGAEEEV